MAIAAAEEAPSVLFDTAPAAAPTIYPTRLRPSHVLVGVAFLLAAATLSVLIGPADLPAGAVIKYLLSKLPFVHLHSGLSTTGAIVVWQLRMPRMVLGGLVGAMLAVAGASYQGVFANPLADPYLLGIASGAGAGATIVIVEGPALGNLPQSALPPAAFIGGVIAVAATFALGRARAADRSAASMLLAGVAVSAFFVAVQTFLMQRSSPGDLTLVYGWILGGLSTAGWGQVGLVLPYVAVAAAVLFACRGSDQRRGTGVTRPSRGNPGGNSRHRSCRIGERSYRFRRDHRAAHDPPYRGPELSQDHPALLAVRRRLPYPCGHPRSDRPIARGGAARGRDGFPGCPVLPSRAPASEKARLSARNRTGHRRPRRGNGAFGRLGPSRARRLARRHRP